MNVCRARKWLVQVLMLIGVLWLQAGAASAQLVLTTQFDQFLVNGRPKFLVFVSYFDAMRASDATLDSDFQYMRSKQVDGIRILPNWLDWGTPPVPAGDTLMDANGDLRPARLTRLKQVLNKAKAWGLLVDVSFTCDTVSGLIFDRYKDGLIDITNELSGDAYRHVLFDLQNESSYLSCNGVGSPMSNAQRLDMRNVVKAADPLRIVTVSTEQGFNASQAVSAAHSGLQDVVAYHEPRTATWYSDTGAVIANLRAAMNCGAHLVNTANFPGTTPCKPLYLQEPERWRPAHPYTGANFITAVTQAKNAGAAAWCFHTEAAFDLAGASMQAQLAANEVNFFNGLPGALASTAWEADNVMETWRLFFGVGGPGGDDDADGAANVTEFLAGTHPRTPGGMARYFVEGINSTFYGTRLAMWNAEAGGTPMLVRFVKDDGSMASVVRWMDPQARHSIDTTKVPGMREMGFSTIIEAPGRIVSERTMYWDRVTGYEGAAERAILNPAPVWYLAEGSTGGPFDLHYILQNPTPSAMVINITYYQTGVGPTTFGYNLPANSRRRIVIDTEPGLGGADVGARLASTGGQSFLVERVMYLSGAQTFAAGHGNAAARDAAIDHYFAEGSTGSFFDTFLTLVNPQGSNATVDVTYFVGGGSTIVRSYSVPAQRRMTIAVDADPALANVSFGAQVHVTNGVPIVAERVVWWPQGGWHGSHSSVGEGSVWANWATAEADVNANQATFLLVVNTSFFGDTVTAQARCDDGVVQTAGVWVPSRGRVSIDVGSTLPVVVNRRCAVTVRSPANAQLAVERSTYWNAGGVGWAAGVNTFATRIP